MKIIKFVLNIKERIVPDKSESELLRAGMGRGAMDKR
jgi:hypothetical protein